MSEEEKKAIWYFGEVLVDENDMEQWKIIENLIDKLQKQKREYEYTIAEMVQTREDYFISKDKINNVIKKYEEELKYEITRNEAKIIISVLEKLLKEN